jgi:hypothetical protein
MRLVVALLNLRLAEVIEVVLVLFIVLGVVKLSAKSLLVLLKVTLPVGPLVVVLPDSTVHPVLHNGCLLQPS